MKIKHCFEKPIGKAELQLYSWAKWWRNNDYLRTLQSQSEDLAMSVKHYLLVYHLCWRYFKGTWRNLTRPWWTAYFEDGVGEGSSTLGIIRRKYQHSRPNWSVLDKCTDIVFHVQSEYANLVQFWMLLIWTRCSTAFCSPCKWHAHVTHTHTSRMEMDGRSDSHMGGASGQLVTSMRNMRDTRKISSATETSISNDRTACCHQKHIHPNLCMIINNY